METVYIVKGGPITQDQVNEIDAWPQEAVGKPEWQFSDAPSGERGSSADYCDLRQALADHPGCRFDTTEADFTAEEAMIFAFAAPLA